MIRVHGLGIGPVKWMTEGRREVKELTGQPVVPVLTNLGQTDAVERIPAHLERILALVLLPPESLLVPGM